MYHFRMHEISTFRSDTPGRLAELTTQSALPHRRVAPDSIATQVALIPMTSIDVAAQFRYALAQAIQLRLSSHFGALTHLPGRISYHDGIPAGATACLIIRAARQIFEGVSGCCRWEWPQRTAFLPALELRLSRDAAPYLRGVGGVLRRVGVPFGGADQARLDQVEAVEEGQHLLPPAEGDLRRHHLVHPGLHP